MGFVVCVAVRLSSTSLQQGQIYLNDNESLPSIHPKNRSAVLK